MKTQIIHPLPSSPADSKTVRLLSIGDFQVSDHALLFNGGPQDYRSKLFAISAPLGNFGHTLAILWSEGEQTVLDDAVNANLLDNLQIEEKDATEETARLGNASEPFDLTDVRIDEIKPAVWQADWQFCIALGRAQEGGIETGADL